jgi:hypothetical protein
MTGIVIYSVIVLALLVAIYRAPVVAMAPVMCMFGLEQWAQTMVPFFTENKSFTNVMAGLLVVFGLFLTYLRRRDISLSYSMVAWLVLILFFYAFTSSLMWAPNVEKGLELWAKRLPYIATIVVAAPLLIRSTGDFQRICWSVLLLGATVTILMLIYGQWSGRHLALAGMEDWEEGGNPLAAAQMAGYVALAAIFLNSRRMAPPYQVVRWLLVGACLMLAAKSGSRGQFYGILLVAAVFLLFTAPSKGMRGAFWATAGLGSVLALGGWVLDSIAEGNRWTVEGMGESSSIRWYAITRVLGHWYSSPGAFFFGLGNSASYDERIHGGYPHVVPLEILGEEGLVGFGLFLAIVFLAMRSFVRVYRLMKHDDYNRGALLVLGAWFSYDLVLSLKQGSMLGSLLLFLFAIMLNQYEKAIAADVIFPVRRRFTPRKQT